MAVSRGNGVQARRAAIWWRVNNNRKAQGTARTPGVSPCPARGVPARCRWACPAPCAPGWRERAAAGSQLAGQCAGVRVGAAGAAGAGLAGPHHLAARASDRAEGAAGRAPRGGDVGVGERQLVTLHGHARGAGAGIGRRNAAEGIEHSGEGGGARLPFSTVTFVGNPDEEIGSPVSTPIIREVARDADVCLVLECARANGDIVSARKGNLGLALTVPGRAAHAGVEPEKGRSAILAAAHLVVDLHALNGRWPGVTVNVGVIDGGTRPNVVAERTSLRYVTKQPPHYFARTGLGEVGSEKDIVGTCECPDLLRHVRPQFFAQLRSRLMRPAQRNEGDNGLALDLVIASHHRGFGNSGMVDER